MQVKRLLYFTVLLQQTEKTIQAYIDIIKAFKKNLLSALVLLILIMLVGEKIKICACLYEYLDVDSSTAGIACSYKYRALGFPSLSGKLTDLG